MKRSEMIKLITSTYIDHTSSVMLPSEAEAILDAMENAGILPPTNTCKLISDGKGGVKHSPTAREWDEE